MSSEAILRAVAEASDREVEAILADARRRADALVADAQRAADARVAEGLAASEPELLANAARAVNAARLRLLHCLAERRAERLAAVFDVAGQQLRELRTDGPARHRSAVGRLARLAAAQAGPGAVVSVPPADVPAARTAIRGTGTAVGNGEIVAGVLAQSADGRMRVDATLARRLDRARTLLADQVDELLERGAASAAGGR